MKEDKIIEETPKKKTNTFINILILLVIFIVSIIMYAKYIGIRGINTREYRITSKQLPNNFSGVKVIYISDILYSSTDLDKIDLIVESINELKPDIVLFGGNLLSKNYKLEKKEKQKIIDLLSKIDSSLGSYAVLGKYDNEVTSEILTSSNFKIINNNYELIYKTDLTPICLVGISSYTLGDYDLEKSFEIVKNNPNYYVITFTHESDIIDKILELEKKPNLILAGNSLGGEINIPFYGPITKFEGSKKYYLEKYEKGETLIYISNGVGTEKYNARLFNRPSFSLFRLKSLH